MENIFSEQTLRIQEAAKIAHVSFATLWRWILRGVPDPNGVRVRLEALRCGGKWLTSREALVRFAKRLTPDLSDQPASLPRPPHKRKHASQKAAVKLQEMGI
jgi:hypothetical protein